MGQRSTCERARYWAGLAPDGTLSQLEQRLLDGHLRQCADCNAFAATVGRAADALRTAPLEQLRSSIHLSPPARHRARRLSAITVAAGVAATITAVTAVPLQRGTSVPERIGRPAIVVDATTIEGEAEQREFLYELRDYRNAQHARESELAVNRRPGSDAA